LHPVFAAGHTLRYVIKIILDQKRGKLRVSVSPEEEARLKAEADALGLSLEEHLQHAIDQHARKMFPAAFKGKV